MWDITDNSYAIYQFTIIIIFITSLLFFVAMYWYSLSLQKTTREQEQTRQKLRINELELETARMEREMLEREKKTQVQQRKYFEEEVQIKSQELISFTLMINQQQKVIQDMEGALNELERIEPKDNPYVKRIKKIIRKNQQMENNWGLFRTQFEKIYPKFFDKLENLQGLTQNDIRHCAFIRMRMNTKEIAQLLNISPTSVQISRVRLKKKLGLSRHHDLRQYIINL